MATSSSKAESIGRWLGRSWRSVARQDAYASRWMMDQGTSPLVAKSLLWIVKLAIVAILLYAAFWFVVLLMLAIVVAAIARNGDEQQQQDWFPKPTDHRDEPFYHPLSYNDDPDPRFEDD